MKMIKTILTLMLLNFLLVIPNITLNEWIYLSIFAGIMIIFRKKKNISAFALMIIFISLIFQLNDFLIPSITDTGKIYWAVNHIANGINLVLFISLIFCWLRVSNKEVLKKVCFDELGLAVWATCLILTGYFILRFIYIEFKPRELLFIFELFEAGVVFFVLRDVLLLRNT